MSNDVNGAYGGAARGPVERRRGLDRRGKIGLALSIIGWTLWAAGLSMISLAAPETTNIIDKFLRKTARTRWDSAYLYVAIVLFAMGCLLCIISLYQFRKRYRRRADKKHTGIITALVINLLFFFAFGAFTIYLDFF